MSSIHGFLFSLKKKKKKKTQKRQSSTEETSTPGQYVIKKIINKAGGSSIARERSHTCVTRLLSRKRGTLHRTRRDMRLRQHWAAGGDTTHTRQALTTSHTRAHSDDRYNHTNCRRAAVSSTLPCRRSTPQHHHRAQHAISFRGPGRSFIAHGECSFTARLLWRAAAKASVGVELQARHSASLQKLSPFQLRCSFTTRVGRRARSATTGTTLGRLAQYYNERTTLPTAKGERHRQQRRRTARLFRRAETIILKSVRVFFVFVFIDEREKKIDKNSLRRSREKHYI